MTSIYVQIAEVLIDIEKEMRELQLWQSEPPSAEALASQQPFCIDTLSFPQWLQFIFLPRLYELLDQQGELPASCGIAPLAEEYFKDLAINSAQLIAHIARVDSLITSR